MDHPRPNMKYVDAKDLDEKGVKLDGLEVDSPKGEKLGKLEGFIIDVNSGRPYHVVVGSGGWFKHKHFLLPIGHVALDPSNTMLLADITKDRVERFPGFDKDEFKKLSEADLKGMNTTMIAACCPGEVGAVEVWETSHYTYPTWWEAGYYRPDRADNAFRDMAGASHAAGTVAPGIGATATEDRGRAREQVVASERAGDVSPHVDGRAQPGDVLGVESGGERTYVGDTSEDENTRRRDAEKAAKP